MFDPSKVRPRNLGVVQHQEFLGDPLMKLINTKFAASACLFTLLAAPAIVLADRPDYGRPDKGGKKGYPVPEPSTLAMTVVGMGLGLGLVIAGIRRNRKTSAA